MKEQNIIKMKIVTSVLFSLISIALIIIGFTEEYRSSSLFSGGLGGLAVSLWMLRSVWTIRNSQVKREELIISETDERNIQIYRRSAALAFIASIISTFTVSILAALFHKNTISTCLVILLGIQILSYFIFRMFIARKL